MVKKAEKVKKRSPFLPVFGLILAATLFILALFAAKPGVDLLRKISPFNPSGRFFEITTSAATNQPQIRFPSGEYLWMTIAIWVLFLVISYTLVAILIGKHPESAKDVKLPPRNITKRR
jgi:hypothetical protein